jgi:hypothetical protein
MTFKVLENGTWRGKNDGSWKLKLLNDLFCTKICSIRQLTGSRLILFHHEWRAAAVHQPE